MIDNRNLLPGHHKDEESEALVSIAEAASLGARNAVLEEVHRAEQVAVAPTEVGPQTNGVPPSRAMVAGVLPLPRAEIAAAEGALKGVHVEVCLLPPVARKLVSSADLLQLQAAAATGAAAGVRGSVFMAPLAANPPELDKNIVATAAGSGAYGACYHTIRTMPRKPTVNQWATRLPPVLGASLALAAGVYPRFSNDKNDKVIASVYGGLSLVIFMLMVGIVASPFRSMSPETVSRHVTFASFTTLIALLTAVLCTLLSGKGFIASVVVVGVLAAACLMYLWSLSNQYYRGC